MSRLPLTPSDSKEYQDSHPIRPQDEFIVSMECSHQETFTELKKVFNKHGKGKISVALTNMFWVKDIDWDIVNELRRHPKIVLCGPTAK